MQQIMYFVILSVILAGCATKQRTIEKPVIQTVTVKPHIPIKKRPDSVSMRNVEFFVVTEDNYEEFKEKFLSKNSTFVFVAISISDYENISLNLADLQRYINQQREIIVFYEKAVK